MKKLILFIMGPQGSGKDTQADLLSKEYKIPTISAGGLLRAEVKRGTELGKEIDSYISKGYIVPTRIIYNLLMREIEKESCKNGFILNGYPRNTEQAEMIKGKIEPTAVILLNIPDEIAISRITHRRICPKCGKVFIVKNNKPEYCDVCHVKLVKREDDKEEIVKKRLKLYHEKTEPLKEIYKDKLEIIDGTKTIREVFEEIKSRVEKRIEGEK